jgi:hypothetical protein
METEKIGVKELINLEQRDIFIKQGINNSYYVILLFQTSSITFNWINFFIDHLQFSAQIPNAISRIKGTLLFFRSSCN